MLVVSMTTVALVHLFQIRFRWAYSADLIVFLIISWLLNSITTDHSGVAVVVVGCVGGEVHLAEEFRLVVLEFADHLDSSLLRFNCAAV